MITKLEQLIPAVQQRGKRRLVAAYAEDAHTLQAIDNASRLGLVDAILIGNRANITRTAELEGIDLSDFIIQEEQSDVACVARAVQMIHHGEADVLMKGLVSTDRYMRGILNKESGLVPPKTTLSHVCVLEIPSYHKLLIITDVAVLVLPDLQQKIQLTYYVRDVAQSLGIETPKIALLSATEQMLHHIPSCYDAAIIAKMWERGQILDCIVDGPLSLDAAVDEESVRIKKTTSPVAGDADCLLFPSLEAGNIFFKGLTKFAGAKMAGMVVGAKVPCVLTSRGDSEESKLYSIALAALAAK